MHLTRNIFASTGCSSMKKPLEEIPSTKALETKFPEERLVYCDGLLSNDKFNILIGSSSTLRLLDDPDDPDGIVKTFPLKRWVGGDIISYNGETTSFTGFFK